MTRMNNLIQSIVPHKSLGHSPLSNPTFELGSLSGGTADFQVVVGEQGFYDISGQCDCGACDCACGDCGGGPGLGYYHNHESMSLETLAAEWYQSHPYKVSPGLIPMSLTDNYYVIANPSAQPGITLLSLAAYELLSEFIESRPISAIDGIESKNVAELAHAKLLVSSSDSETHIKSQMPRTLVSWLHITNACPLACKYCHVEKTSAHMSEEIGRTAVETVFREAIKHGFEEVKLKYSGGEPSLNLDLVEQLHKLATQKAKNSGLNLDEVLLTSGVMSASARERIINMGIKVMVSLDALGEEHDAQRPLLCGQPSGHITQDSLMAFKEAGLDISVSTVVARQSAEALTQLIDVLLDLDIPFGLNYARDNPNFADRDEFKPQNPALAITMGQVIAHLCQNPPKRSLLGSLVDRANLSGPHCYTCAVGRNYLVIDHLGRISKCQQEMKTPLTSIYESDPLKTVNGKGLENLSVAEKEGCRACKWRYWCTGGCAALTNQIYSRSDVQSPFCDVYKAIIPEVVRLEGLRLLKYGQSLE